MKASETSRNPKAAGGTVKHRAARYTKVRDGRKQAIRGLWLRGTRFYARLNVADPLTGEIKTRRVALLDKEGKPVQSVPKAIDELKRLQTQRLDDALPILERTPKFRDYAKQYLAVISSGQGAKKPGTIEKEKGILDRWAQHLGELRLNQVKRVHVNRFIEERLAKSLAPRTINLDVITFRVLMKRAQSDNLIQRLPTDGLKPLKVAASKRSLFSANDLEKLCGAAFESKTNKRGEAVALTENAQQFIDYVRLMSYCGARRNEALGLKWSDVDFDKGQLWIRRQITKRGAEDVKNSEQRVLDFNPKLRAHLVDMQKRRAPDSGWLFPSSQRGTKDLPAKSFRESLVLVRERANMVEFGFHDCRHHFISMCVMSGIDYMTIASWVGHKDGGVLIGKVYGHLHDDHRRRMADKLTFEPSIVALQASNG